MYLSIHDLTLDRFIICLCDEDLTALIIEGSVPKEKLEEVWQIINQDFSDSICDETQQAATLIIRKINLLEFKITKTVAIQTYLSYRHDDEYVQLLQQIGAADSKFPDVPHLQQSWWKRITGRVKRWKTEIEAEKKRLELIQRTMPGTSGKVTRDGFQDLIIQVEKHMKFHISEKETTAGRFVAMLKDYQLYLIALSRNKNKK